MEAKYQSIYDYMAANLKGDSLPEDFSLPSETGTLGDLTWTDGAMDGVFLYHTAHGKLPEEASREIAAAADAASSGDAEAADAAFHTLAKDFQAIAVLDALLQYVVDHQDRLNAANIYQFALHLMIESPFREEVKLGLILMRLFDTDQDVLRDTIRSLGLSDEFTFYSVLNMSGWENASEEIFDLAKHVRGWGRIHAVEYLEPETEEMREWLLLEGIHNTIMPEYSALAVFEKAGVKERLSRSPESITPAEFTAIGGILAVLLREGPVSGISELAEPEAVLESYLKHAAQRKLSLRDLEYVSAVYYYASGEDPETAAEKKESAGERMSGIAAEAVKILRTQEAESLIREGLAKGEDIELAIALGIPTHRELFTLMQQDFEKNYGLCAYLMDNVVYSEAALDLFRKKIPLEELKSDPKEEAGDEAEYYEMLSALLQAMGGECRTAGDILMKAVSVPHVRCRYFALQCLDQWTKAAGQPLKNLSARLYEKLREACVAEPRKDLKKAMEKLLEENTQ